MEYKLMTFNIQSCKDYITKEFDHKVCCKLINEVKPDILCLNEVRTKPFKPTNNKSWFDQTEKISSEVNLPNYFFGKAIELEGNYGNSILSKYKINNPQIYKIDDPIIKDEDAFYESRIVIHSKIEGINFIITHMGLAKSERINAVKKVVELINTLDGKIVLMGDFNMEKDNPILAPINNLLVDTSKYIKEPLLTYPSINPKMKIDYIFVSKDIEILEAKIITKVASDHFPVYAKISVK